jgi:chromate transporter
VRITRLSAVHESLRCRHVTQHENAVFVSLETSPTERPHQHGRLVELTRPFLKLGAISFGGPAAHIALMRDEVVERRQWPTEQESLDLLGATNLIPGANSTEMAIHIGHRRAGIPGLLVAGTCFILPAVAIVSTLAWVYARFGTMPQARALLAGITAVIIAVIVQAMWALGLAAVKIDVARCTGCARRDRPHGVLARGSR